MEAEAYVANPEKLKLELGIAAQISDSSVLSAPFPDPYSYRMMRYQGFVRYPERLKNYLVAQDESSVRSSMPTLYGH